MARNKNGSANHPPSAFEKIVAILRGKLRWQSNDIRLGAPKAAAEALLKLSEQGM
jgi:hypothetical protein